MKISKYLIIDEAIVFSKHKVNRIKKNKSVKNVYLVCTGMSSGYLFEIIEGKYRLTKYNEAYLVGIASTKEQAIRYVQTLVDDLYNTKKITCDELKT